VPNLVTGGPTQSKSKYLAGNSGDVKKYGIGQGGGAVQKEGWVAKHGLPAENRISVLGYEDAE